MWSKQELQILEDNKNLPVEQIKLLLPNRTVKAIQIKASRLNTTLNIREYILTKEFLEEELKTKTTKQIGKETNTSKSAVERKMAKLGILGYNPRERKANAILGQKFGKLYIESNTLSKHGRYTVFHCLCDCGKRKDINYENLLVNNINHCGCETKLKNRTTRQKDENVCKDLLSKCKTGAKKRKIPFDLSIQDIWSVYLTQNKRCAITGVPIIIVSSFTHIAKDRTASIDRKDSNKGYTKDNIQIVHKRVNVIKGNMSIDELKYWASMIYNNLGCNKDYFGPFSELGPHKDDKEYRPKSSE